MLRIRASLSRFAPRVRDFTTVILGGEAARGATISAIRRDLIKSSNQIVCIGEDSWVSKAHEDWNERPWGQPASYFFPEYLEVFKKAFPSYCVNKKMNFAQVKETYAVVKDNVKKLEIPFYDIPVQSIIQTSKGLNMTTKSGKSYILCSSKNFHIFNAFKQPSNFRLPNGFSLRTYSDVYARSKQDIKNGGQIAMFGSGLNVNWAARDLAGVTNGLIYLIPPRDIIRQDILDNSFCRSVIDMNAPGFEMHSVNDELCEIRGKDLKHKKEGLKILLPKANLFHALGNVSDKSTVQVDSNKVIHIDTGAKADAVFCYRDFSGNLIKKTDDMRGTIAPVGNLTHVFYSILACLDSGSKSPMDSGHEMFWAYNVWKSKAIGRFLALKHEVNPAFFDQLLLFLKNMGESCPPMESHVLHAMKLAYLSNAFKGIGFEEFQAILAMNMDSQTQEHSPQSRLSRH